MTDQPLRDREDAESGSTDDVHEEQETPTRTGVGADEREREESLPEE
jgi:hypothetical protein